MQSLRPFLLLVKRLRNMKKPLFIPLKTEYFEAFAAGTKTEEFRLFGKRWNFGTVEPGQLVTLSHGYGPKRRLYGVVSSLKLRPLPGRSTKRHGPTLPGWRECYGVAASAALIIGITLFSLTPRSKAENQKLLQTYALTNQQDRFPVT